jgi:hypothetical protein
MNPLSLERRPNMRSFAIVSCAALVALVLAYSLQRTASAPSPVEAIVIQDDGQRRPGSRGAGAAIASMLGQRDELAETLTLLGDLNLTPSFTLSQDQKVQIQAIRDRLKQAQETWRKEHQSQLDLVQDQARGSPGAGGSAAAGQELRRKRQELTATAPKTDEAAKEILAVLTADQRKAFDAKMTQRRDEQRKLRERVREDIPGRRNPLPERGQVQRN